MMKQSVDVRIICILTTFYYLATNSAKPMMPYNIPTEKVKKLYGM